MHVRPIVLREARAFIGAHHRHSEPPRGWLFGVALENESTTVGVGVAGRPVARLLDDGLTVEITRTCTTGEKNANSMIYGALCRAAKALGYRSAITYTLPEESGASLRAAGFVLECDTAGDAAWSRVSRPRQDETLFGARRPQGKKNRWRRWL